MTMCSMMLHCVICKPCRKPLKSYRMTERPSALIFPDTRLQDFATYLCTIIWAISTTVTVVGVIEKYLSPLEVCVRSMLDSDGKNS